QILPPGSPQDSSLDRTGEAIARCSSSSPPCSAHPTPSSFFFSSSGAPRDLHSFPTRRSSDLSREGSRNRRRLKANQTGKKFRVGIKSNISTNRNNLISGVDRCIHLNAMKKTTITSINRQTIKI